METLPLQLTAFDRSSVDDSDSSTLHPVIGGGQAIGRWKSCKTIRRNIQKP